MNLIRLLFYVAVSGTFPVFAHHPVTRELPPGTRPCVDEGSVEVVMQGPQGDVMDAARAITAASVTTEVVTVLAAFGADDVRHALCPGDRHYVHVRLAARYLDPATYLNFPADTYSVEMALLVGPGETSRAERGQDPDQSVFGFGLSDLHSEAETDQPVELRLVTLGRQAANALGTAYAASRPQPFHETLAARLLASATALLAGAAIALSVVRRRGSGPGGTR